MAVGAIAFVVVVLFGQGSIGGLLDGDLTSLWIALSVLAFVGLLIPVAVATNRREHRFREQFRSFLSLERPHSACIAGPQPVTLVRQAQQAGASTELIGGRGLVGLTVGEEGAEVWIPGDLAPRWRVQRAEGWVRVVPTTVGSGGYKYPYRLHAIEISDGTRSASVIPALQPARGAKQRPSAAFVQALRDLGEDPADHLVR
ncbi:hypothetical protein [Antribacter gilvus]|uniref:hypothetical protein n=1 Tax=Antribacter gilvus TaxID=2304675 RepID=UPI000F7B6CF5|nr:hypothetical protein [Antribacter gilvus]